MRGRRAHLGREGTVPVAAKRSTMAGSVTNLPIAAFHLSITSFGVPFGA